jgi:hypothetical protein
MGPTALLPSEGRRAADFITLKIHRPLPGLNPRTTRPPRATLYYIILLYITALLCVATNYCRLLQIIVVLIVFYLFRIYAFFVCLLNGLPLYFVQHLKMWMAPLDPRPVTDRNMAQMCNFDFRL